jgi:AraC family transcriptional regulator, regulatory protein of adaptative response / methylated-DNA-[protein]-cysteine methyltransferase
MMEDGMADGAFEEAEPYHSALIRRAIARIDAADRELSLEELAADMQMSSAHFQRLFSRWAGVSPKRYQQYLTLGLARRLLQERFTTLEVADAAGLSGQGRLHDLTLRWEAMTPGEVARRGDGLTVRWGTFDGPFGGMLAMGTDRGLCGLAFTDEAGEDAAFADLTGRWPAAAYVEDPDAVAPWVEAALARSGEARLHLIGGPFQIKVWEALMTIPSGYVTTYSEIARVIGHPTAVRAVGTAVGRNPVSWLIPCHRALRKSGGLGGYHWGLPVKRTLLAREALELDAR